MAVALDDHLELDPMVSLRAERFGALAYHFGTRKLSFLKHPDLVRVVEGLSDHDDVRAAFEAAGVDERRWPAFLSALSTLQASEMLRSTGPGRAA